MFVFEHCGSLNRSAMTTKREVAQERETATSLADNLLLGTLEEPVRELLAPHMQRVPLEVRDVVYTSGRPITHVYFPVEGVVSMTAEIHSELAVNSMVEVATIGNEGMAGLQIFLGTDTTPGYAFAQVPGSTLKMEADQFRVAAEDPDFARLLHRYTQALLVQISQATACNRVHSVEQRCARWLLMTHDRMPGNGFDLTQEFLAQMLGERRGSVNGVATALQQAGFIRYLRGHMTILDRAGLESVSCGCYRIVRDEYDRMLGGTEQQRSAGSARRRAPA
jgi:CRP-like cAMP-binding protein